MRKAFLVIPFIFMLVGYPVAASTEYDKLNNFSPESTVKTFIAAYSTGNFSVVYLLLDNEARIELRKYPTITFYYCNYFSGASATEVYPIMENLLKLNSDHSIYEIEYFFHEIMTLGKQSNRLYFTFGNYRIMGIKDSFTFTNRASKDIAVNDDTCGKVIFRLTKTISNRWKVFQVIAEHGDESLLPWAVEKYIQSK